MKNELKKRNVYIDYLKGILILIVVFRHIFQVSALDSDTNYLCNLMAIVEMPLFMMISGYLSLNKIENNNIDVRNKIKKNTLAYLVPFISYFIIFKLIFLNYYTGLASLTDIFYNITLSLWYLYVIWFFSIISIFSYKICQVAKKNNFKIIVFTCLFFLFILIYLLNAIFVNINFLGCKLIVLYSFFYIVGIWFKNYEENIKKIYNKYKNIILTCAVAIFFIGGKFISALCIEDNIYGLMIRWCLGLFASIVVMEVAYDFYKIGVKKQLIIKIGTSTLEIYYVHSMLMNILRLSKADTLFSQQGMINVLIESVFISISCFMIIEVIKLNDVTNLIIFGKQRKKTKN